MTDFVIMDITNGDLVGSVYETEEEAAEWIAEQEEEYKFEIIARK